MRCIVIRRKDVSVRVGIFRSMEVVRDLQQTRFIMGQDLFVGLGFIIFREVVVRVRGIRCIMRVRRGVGVLESWC